MSLKKLILPATAVIFYILATTVFFNTVYPSETFQKISLSARDVFFKIRARAVAPPKEISNILLVGVDEESCRKLGLRWPWSRTELSKIVRNLSARGAQVTGLNFSFTGAESVTDEASRVMAQALQESRKVVLGATFDDRGKIYPPYEPLENAADGYGYLEKIQDIDACIRRSYLLRPYRNSDRFEPSFSLKLLEIYFATDSSQRPVSYDAEYQLLKISRSPKPIHLDPDGSYDINFLAEDKNFRMVPAWKVIENRIRPEEVQGRLVIVGLNDSSLGDLHNTPLGMMPGMCVHANEALSILSGRSLSFLPDPLALGVSAAVGFCVLGLFLWGSFWIGMAGFLIAFFGEILGIQALLMQDVSVDPLILLFGPALALTLGASLVSFSLFLEREGLKRQVVKDKLTGLYTYDFLRQRLQDEWRRCSRLKLPISVVMTDLDHFKKINDTLGHETGNDMICRAAEVIRKSVRGYDVVSRYGGDEFVVLLWHASVKEAEDYRQRLRHQYESMAQLLSDPLLKASSMSIGIAVFDPSQNPTHPKNPQNLIELADQNLFEDKKSRRGEGRV